MTQIRKTSFIAAFTFALSSGLSILPGTARAHTDLVCATQCYHGGGGTTQQCAAKCVGHVHGGSGGGSAEPESEDKTTESDDTEESNALRGLLNYKKLPQ